MSKKDPKDIVGESWWKVLHTAAATVDLTNPEEVKQFKNLVISYTHLFPCMKCRENLKKKLNDFPPDMYMSSNDELFFLIYMYHDIVNKQNGKVSPPYKEYKDEVFSQLRNFTSCSNCIPK